MRYCGNRKLKNKRYTGTEKEYEAKLYNERTTAAEKNSRLRKEKDAEISKLNSKISRLEERLHAAENEIVRLKNMMNKDSSNSSKPPSSDEPWEGRDKKERRQKKKAANEYNSRKPSERHKGGRQGIPLLR